MPDEPAPITQMVGSEVIRPRYLKVTPASRFSWDESQLRLGRGWVRAAAAHKCDLELDSEVKSAEMRPESASYPARRRLSIALPRTHRRMRPDARSRSCGGQGGRRCRVAARRRHGRDR